MLRLKKGQGKQLGILGVETGIELLGELRHLRAARWANCAHHVATLRSLLHSSLIVRHSFLLLTFHTKHFSQ